MLIFVAAGIVFDGSGENADQVEYWKHRYRRWNYSLRLAREAGDFGGIVRYEQFVDKEAQWLRWYLTAECGVSEATVERLEPYLADEIRMMRHRTEHCRWCWYGVGEAPPEVADNPGSDRWPEKTVYKRRLRPGGKVGWAIVSERLK